MRQIWVHLPSRVTDGLRGGASWLSLQTLVLIDDYRKENLSNSKLKAGLTPSDLSYLTPLPRYVFFPVPSFLN